MPYREQQPLCPKCGTALQSAQSDEVAYACCPGCRGIWLSAEGLQAVLLRRSAHNAAHIVSLLDAGFPRPTQRPCVGCGMPLLARHIFDIEVDYCTACKGIFLDDGEFDEVVLADAAYDPAQGIPSDSERLMRTIENILLRPRYGWVNSPDDD